MDVNAFKEAFLQALREFEEEKSKKKLGEKAEILKEILREKNELHSLKEIMKAGWSARVSRGIEEEGADFWVFNSDEEREEVKSEWIDQCLNEKSRLENSLLRKGVSPSRFTVLDVIEEEKEL